VGDVIQLPVSTVAEMEADIMRVARSWSATTRERAEKGDAARMLAQALTAMGWKK
jgi:hypothetical protein